MYRFRAALARRTTLPGFLLLLFAMLCSAIPGLAEDELGDLSLEDLLGHELDKMSITGIHHTHDQGEWMVGVAYHFMHMDGLRDGTDDVSLGDVAAEGFMIAPTSMNMNMLMFHLMYGVTDWFTVGVMMPYTWKTMDHEIVAGMMSGTEFTVDSNGAGDLKLNVLFSAYESAKHHVIVELGASFPTGSIDEKGETPMSGGQKVRLPYPMQLGSGTYDLMPMLTYIGQSNSWQWGGHAMGLFRIGENDNDYRLGHRYALTGWGSRLLTQWLSASVRLEWSGWGNIEGADPLLNPNMVPTADPDRQAGRRLDLLFGFNLFSFGERLEGARIATEVGVPIYQWLDGPQLETDVIYRLSVEWTF